MIAFNGIRPRLRVSASAAALFGALVLAGCSSTHVGETWQCPLAQGGSCESVAGADPAVPARIEGGGTVLPVPLYRVRAGRDAERPRATVRAERPCDTDCGPFAWLARLFAADGGGDAKGAAARSPAPKYAARPVIENALPPMVVGPAVDGAAVDGPAIDDAPVRDGPAPVDAAGDLREAEIVGRIWIAPFVDGGGIYREGAYVRAVLAPAGWKIP